MIDWSSAETHLFLNPRMPAGERTRLERLASVATLAGHVWIATSGTSGSLKLTALSKRALLASASAVNERLGATRSDVWLCVLPTFHVGGLGIHARAALSRSRVVSLDWDAAAFADAATREGATLSSLVPSQVRDLVAAGVEAPPSMRAVVVGGGALAADLYEAGCALGWPLLPSYGMTECCSQIATAEAGSRELRLLRHVDARSETDGRLAFRSEALLTGYARYAADGRAEFVDPKSDGWFVSEDRGTVDGAILRVTGRGSDFVKVGGESVDLKRLDAILDQVRGAAEAAIVALADERLGSAVWLATTAEDAGAVTRAFNERVLPFERIRGVRRVRTIPRTELGKLKRVKLASMLTKDEGK